MWSYKYISVKKRKEKCGPSAQERNMEAQEESSD